MQSYLYSLITPKTIRQSGQDASRSVQEFLQATVHGLSAAFIILATLPIMVAYPVLQRNFVSGLTLGSLQG